MLMNINDTAGCVLIGWCRRGGGGATCRHNIIQWDIIRCLLRTSDGCNVYLFYSNTSHNAHQLNTQLTV